MADTTLEKDREVKTPLYAKAGIAEYWILNIPDKQLEIYSYPVDGKYQNQLTVKGKESAILEAFDVSIKVADIFILKDI